MDLSDSEKRDLTKLIESNKPLPDQYRFRLFEKSDEIELLWNGKSNEITNVNLPFQIIELVDEPRKNIEPQLQGNLFDTRGRKQVGWTNKLIWGNNSLVLSSLINGPLRKEIEEQGGLKLVYIDPPFNVGDDFEFDINIGNQTLSKKRNALEQLAFSDTWGKQEDSFLSMMYERLKLIHALMSNDGCLFVHCDWRVSFLLRSILNEIFGADAFVNEIIWRRRLGKTSPDTNRLENTVDNILFYSKSLDPKINFEYTKFGSEDYLKDSFKNVDEKGRRYQSTALNAPVKRPTLVYDFMGYKPHPNGWSVSKETMQKYYEEDKLIFPKNKDGRIRRKQYLDEWKG